MQQHIPRWKKGVANGSGVLAGIAWLGLSWVLDAPWRVLDAAVCGVAIGMATVALVHHLLTKEQLAPEQRPPRSHRTWLKAVLLTFEPVNVDNIGSVRVPTMAIWARLSLLAFFALFSVLLLVFGVAQPDPKTLAAGAALLPLFLFFSLCDIHTLRHRAKPHRH